MDYHDQIIKIQMPQDDQIRATIEAEDVGEYAVVLAYKYGHRDARHAAAEIAAQADARIAELERWIMEERHRGDTFQGECHNLRAQLEAARAAEAAALKRVAELEEALSEILECPHGVDSVTVPSGGIAKNPSQVVMSFSVGFLKFEKLRALLPVSEIDLSIY